VFLVKVVPSVQRNPLVWALPLQALLLLSNLALLDPWSDESFPLTTAPQPLSQVVSTVAGGTLHPPLYYVLLHYWIQLPWGVSPVVSMRAMSAVWALIATVFIFVLWLRRESPRFQGMFLALWVLSPSLLLHGRMARSYSMQLALAFLAIYSAVRWAEQPRNWGWLLAYVGSSAALLYTHYLSGLSVAAGVCVMFLLKKRFTLAASQVGLLAVLYAPWVPTLRSHLSLWAGGSYPYEGGNIVFDQIVRLAYLFMSFSFGETHFTVSLLLSLALIPVVIYALWQAAVTDRPEWLPIVLTAIGITWIGVSRIEQFVFMPNHLLFALPFFLILILRHINLSAFAALLVLYISADYAYFTKSGFLVKPYAAPYQEMADVIRDGSRGQNAIVALSPHGSFSQPMLNRLGDSVQVILLNDETSAREVLQAARGGPSRPPAIWLWRRTSDVSPRSFVTKLEQDLSLGREGRHREFVAYNLPERWARRLLRGPGQPNYYYRLSEFRDHDHSTNRQHGDGDDGVGERKLEPE
jgi:hypothetical protein